VQNRGSTHFRQHILDMKAVIRDCKKQFTQYNPERLYLVSMVFYADDGAIMGVDLEEVQLLLDYFTTIFACVRLKMNADKTECMIMDGGKVTQPNVFLSIYMKNHLEWNDMSRNRFRESDM
jgi:hypothetical protein